MREDECVVQSDLTKDVVLECEKKGMGIILYSIKNTIITLEEDMDVGEFKLEYINESESIVLFKNQNKIHKQDTV